MGPTRLCFVLIWKINKNLGKKTKGKIKNPRFAPIRETLGFVLHQFIIFYKSFCSILPRITAMDLRVPFLLLIAVSCFPSSFASSSPSVCNHESELFRFDIHSKCPPSMYPTPPIEVRLSLSPLWFCLNACVPIQPLSFYFGLVIELRTIRALMFLFFSY